MVQEPSHPVSGTRHCPDLVQVSRALALLGRQPVLLAVTLQITAAAGCCEITVSKAVDEAGTVLASYWWEVDRLAEDGRGRRHQERRWGLGLSQYETAEAAYQAAVQWVHAQPVAASTSLDENLQ